MNPVALAAQATNNNFCAATLADLATACRQAALRGDLDTVQGLALHSILLGLSQSIGHGPTSSSRVQAMQVQWSPILRMLMEHRRKEQIPDLNIALEQRRHL